MMILITLVMTFIVLLIIGVPIAYVLGCTAMLGIWLLPGMSLITTVQRMFSGLNSFTLLAVPLFIFAANVMNQSGISERIVDFAVAIVGRVRGGLAYANVLDSMLFAGLSGSAQADTAGLGKVVIPAMIREGYDKETAVGVTAATSTLATIIPPSVTMVVYSSVAGVSVGAMFLSGIVPGILIGLGMMGVVYYHAVKHDYPRHTGTTLKQLLKLTVVNVPALLTPLIIIGGINLGFMTATEAASVACIYAMLLGFFAYRSLKLKDFKALLEDTVRTSAVSTFALATANALGQLLSYYNFNQHVGEFFSATFDSRFSFMAIVVLFYIFIGTFMDAIPAIILFVPALMPTATSLGISGIQLGLVIIITLAVGLITPPYGLCLLIASKIGGLTVDRSFYAAAPYIAVALFVVFLVVFVPDVALGLPKLIRPELF